MTCPFLTPNQTFIFLFFHWLTNPTCPYPGFALASVAPPAAAGLCLLALFIRQQLATGESNGTGVSATVFQFQTRRPSLFSPHTEALGFICGSKLFFCYFQSHRDFASSDWLVFTHQTLTAWVLQRICY